MQGFLKPYLTNSPLIKFNLVLLDGVKTADIGLIASKNEKVFLKGHDAGSITLQCHGRDHPPRVVSDRISLTRIQVNISAVAAEHVDRAINYAEARREESTFLSHGRSFLVRFVSVQVGATPREVVINIRAAKDEHAKAFGHMADGAEVQKAVLGSDVVD